jgi:hypothetical protein
LIRTLTPAEAQHGVDWAAAEGWNPGLADLDCFLAQDAGLFLGRFDRGALVSVISATRYPGFGFIGFYIAAPAARGQGHGIACTAPGSLDTREHYAARLRLVSRWAARASRGLRKPFFSISHSAL